MAFSRGPNISTEGLEFLLDMSNTKSFKGVPVTNLLGDGSTVDLYRYNNPSFTGNHVKTTNLHPIHGTPIWELTHTPDNTQYGTVARLSASDGFGCYHSLNFLESNKTYMASISVKEGNTPIISHSGSYSNIGGWGNTGGSLKYYEGDGWWRYYTVWRNRTTSYSADGTTLLSTRTASRIDTTHTFGAAGTYVVQSGAFNPAQYVGNDYYRGTYDFNNSIYTGTGTIVDWGIDSNMTKPTYSPVYNYPNPNFSLTLWYTVSVPGAGSIGTRSYSYGAFTGLSDAKYWKITYDSNYTENLRPCKSLWSAPMVHEISDNVTGGSYSSTKPFKYVNTSRQPDTSLYNLINRESINIADVSFNLDGEMEFDETNDFVDVSIGNPFELRCFEMVFYNNRVIQGRERAIGGANTYQTLVRFNQNYPMGINLGAWSSALVNESLHFWTTGSSPYEATTMTEAIGVGYHHLIVNYNESSSEYDIYIDGVRKTVGHSSQGAAQPFELNHLSFGNSKSPNYPFGGKISMVKAYSTQLTETQVQQNFNSVKDRYNIKVTGVDNTTDSGNWIRFWWYDGTIWPTNETDVLGHPFGTFDSSSRYAFQRLPQNLTKATTELLAKDGAGNIYKWDFSNSSVTAQRVWDSFYSGTQGSWANTGAFEPTVLAGTAPRASQDSWQYRVSEGVVSFLLDDDTCDCYSSLNAGHAMCGSSGWNQTYAQPDGAYLRYGVDLLYDAGCQGPLPTNSLELFYRIK